MDSGKNTSRFMPQVCELSGILAEQVKLARQGNIGKLEVLSEKSGPVVERLAKAGVLEMPEFKEQRKKLQELYKSLCLSLAIEKDSTAGELRRLRRGKKTLHVYRNSI